MTRAYEELVDFIASGCTPDEVMAWTPSPAARERVAELLAAKEAGTISPDEQTELVHCLACEHLMRLAKARARGRRV